MSGSLLTLSLAPDTIRRYLLLKLGSIYLSFLRKCGLLLANGIGSMICLGTASVMAGATVLHPGFYIRRLLSFYPCPEGNLAKSTYPELSHETVISFRLLVAGFRSPDDDTAQEEFTVESVAVARYTNLERTT